MPEKPHTDISPDHIFVKYAPFQIIKYVYLARLDRPIGIWLLLLPGWWSMAMAIPDQQGFFVHIGSFALFGIGAVVMRAAGCVINDLWDRDLDARVTRTQNRPLASGSITPRAALMFLGLMLLTGLLILVQFNTTTIILGVLVLPLITAYPLMKRITWWPQAFLGLTFNFGALMGWSAITGTINMPAVWLYLSGIFWTLGYDTIYAHQDKNDDALIGIKSTALKFGEYSPLWVGGFYGLSWSCLSTAFIVTQGITASVFLLAPLAHFLWQMHKWDTNNPQSALSVFKANRDYGLLIFMICVIVRSYSDLS